MRKPYDVYEDATGQGMFLFTAVFFFMILGVIPAVWERIPVIRFFDDTGSRAVIESCVAEKSPWICLQAFGTALDEQTSSQRWNGEGQRPPSPDRGLIDTFASVVPVSDMLDSCGRTPECMIFMADHGYSRFSIVGELER